MPSGFGFYRDAFYVFILKAFNAKILLHLHGKSIKTKPEYLNYEKKKLYKFLPIYLLAVFTAVLLDIFYYKLTDEQVFKNIFTAIFIPASGTAAFIWYLIIVITYIDNIRIE